MKKMMMFAVTSLTAIFSSVTLLLFVFICFSNAVYAQTEKQDTAFKK